MQRNARVVIGANFGDEGKGVLTDHHAAALGPGTVVVRFNGGAQAGHTVQAPDGRRHVFHHLGAGSFAGAATWLSRFFIANPLLLARELAELRALGVDPAYHVDPAAALTTPFDMMLNQMAEEARGAARHGSCGLGINETVTRNEQPRFATFVRDLADPAALAAKLDEIRADWVPARLAALGVAATPAWRARLADRGIAEAFLALGRANLWPAIAGPALPAGARHLVFEGAQGLLLDERHHFFPHVTRSRTGLTNVLALARELGLDRLDVTYVTRAYATRHGAGPFPGEQPGLRYDDPTNQPNPWQGTLRFGLLDLDLLAASIGADLAQAAAGAGAGIAIRPQLAVTCVDQVGAAVEFLAGGGRRLAAPEGMIEQALARLGFGQALVGRGPTRDSLAPLPARPGLRTAA